MDTQDYRNEVSWRAQMLASQVATRQSIGELGFMISGLFLAYVLSDFWPGLAIVVAAAMCAGAIYAVWRESRAGARLTDELAEMEVEQPR
jgi:hypothetical protein